MKLYKIQNFVFKAEALGDISSIEKRGMYDSKSKKVGSWVIEIEWVPNNQYGLTYKFLHYYDKENCENDYKKLVEDWEAVQREI